jgi:hypothetical protein
VLILIYITLTLNFVRTALIERKKEERKTFIGQSHL